MVTKFYSHSKLSTFEQCPFKYKLRYIDKIKPIIEKTIEAHLGSSVHHALEWLYNFVKENPEKIPEFDEVVLTYISEWEKNFSKNILVVKNNMDYKDYFNKGVEFLLNYYQKNHPFNDGTIECEKKIYIDLDEETKIQGFIDRLVHNIEKGRYEIHDYKTANTLPTQEKMDEDRQLALYSIAIKEIYGEDKEVILVWHYLAHDKKIISKRTKDQLENLKEETKELIKKIESTSEFPINPSVLCNWCEYKEICPAHNPNSPYSTSLKDKNQTNLDDFPTIKKYVTDKERKNPADENGFEMNIF
jgi:putative RecB family exonuclease